MIISTILFALANLTPGANQQGIATVVDANGHPIQGAKVYRVGLALNGSAQFDGTTGKHGTVKLAEYGDFDLLMAVSQDRNIAVSSKSTVRFGPTADISLRFYDADGAPLADKAVCLFPTRDTKPLRGFGVNRFFPNIPDDLEMLLEGQTDHSGSIHFKKLPIGMSFNVELGLDKQALLLFGAVWAGKPERVTVPIDRQMVGRVMLMTNGEPVKGIEVDALDSPIFQLMGYPLRTIGSATTNSKGEFRISGLPPSLFNLYVEGEGYRDENAKWLAELKVGNGQWERNTQSTYYSVGAKSLDYEIRLSQPKKSSDGIPDNQGEGSSENKPGRGRDDVRLRFSDEYGLPLKRYKVFLTQADHASQIRGFGVARKLPDAREESDITQMQTTDNLGMALFHKMQTETPFKVTVGLKLLDALELEGSVYANHTAQITVPLHREIAGHVLLYGSGLPVGGVRIQLCDTQPSEYDDEFVGNPLEDAITDSTGFFRFKNLPACAYRVLIFNKNSSGTTDRLAESRVGKGNWTSDIDDRIVSTAFGNARCDFRLAKQSFVAVRVVSPNGKLVRGFSIRSQYEDRGIEAGQRLFTVLPGRQSFFAEDAARHIKVGKSVEIAQGSDVTVSIVVPAE